MKTSKVVIIGYKGFVGRHLEDFFLKNRDEVVGLDREDMQKSDKEIGEILSGSDIVINLAGVPILGRWTEQYKEALRESRIETTERVVRIIGDIEKRPKLFISTSAVGIYDNRGIYGEDSVNYSNDFLSVLCQDWEHMALRVAEFGVREVVFRFGVVLGRDGGALKQMLLPFKLGLGGKIGSGKQAVSFIHIDDLIEAYRFIVEHKELRGIFNLSSPVPTTNLEMTKALGKALYRPTIFPVPQFVLELIYGEGSRVLTDGQRMLPERLLEAGFKFKFPTIQETINNLA